MNEAIPAAKPPANRKQFFVVLSLFAAPLLLAFAVYYGSGWRPTNMTNKGDLITPAIPLPQISLSKADGTQTDAKFLRGDWTLVYVGGGDCDAACRTALSYTRNARLLLGKDATRVERAFLYSGEFTDPAYFNSEQIGVVTASVDGDAGQALLKLFQNGTDANALNSHRTYIVDPLGNLMMSYAPGTDPRAIYQDLKKLLALSHIG